MLFYILQLSKSAQNIPGAMPYGAMPYGAMLPVDFVLASLCINVAFFSSFLEL